MSGRYRPSSQAVPQRPWNITLLSQRDVGIQIPIDFVTAPGVAVTAACFNHGVYDRIAAVQCLSNLLATGFRRFIFDAYWDQRRLTWSLCPAEIPGNMAQGQPTASVVLPSTTEQPLEGGRLSSDAPSASGGSRNLVVRQARPESENVTFTSARGTGSSSRPGTHSSIQATNTLASQTKSASNGNLFSAGPYRCSKDLGLYAIAEVLNDYLHYTDDTLNAGLKYVIFNLHGASPVKNPASPASKPSNARLPSTPNLIGNIFHTSLSSYMYTPELLQSQRSNLGKSWLGVGNSSQPDPAYFTITDNNNGAPDGWPSESFLEFHDMRRVLIGVENVDPQMADYSFDNDDYIFQEITLSNEVDVNTSPNGTVVDDCIFDAGNAHSIKAANNSWAVSGNVAGSNTLRADGSDRDVAKLSIGNLTSCGYSPILNSTIGRTADVDIGPYQTFVYSSVWSWGWNEPKDDSSKPSRKANGDDASTTDFRCTLFDSSNYGRWRTEICQNNHYAACRTNGAPYSWALSRESGSYSEVASFCPTGTTFAVPRNALENRYLLSAVEDQKLDRGNFGKVWLNLNSLSVQSCWVPEVNATCPYTPHGGYSAREIVIPTVAAIIVIVIALLTLLVKCGANRRRTKRKRRRKRVHKGWEYEGVPQ